MSSRRVASPPIRPLKRSASTASLPTPPRTQRRRRNMRSKRDASSEEDSDAGREGGHGFLGFDEEETNNSRSSKRRRLSDIDDDEEQDAFWAGVGERASVSKSRMSQNLSSRPLSEPEMGNTLDEDNSDSDTSFLSRRRMKQSTTTGSAPVSPPPSHRRPRAAKVSIKSSRAGAIASLRTIVEEDSSSGPGAETKSPANDTAATLTSSPPTTPKTPKSQIRSGISPLMLIHSPDDPFLSSPKSASGSSTTAERLEVKGTVFEEKPTIDMVFRGVKRSMLNPHYNFKTGRAKSPNPKSLLPPEHPDFSPDTRGRPRALWPRKAKNPRPDESEEPTTPTKAKGRNAAALLKTPPMTVKRTAGKVANANKQTLLDSDDEEDQKLDPDAVLPMRPFRLLTEKSS
ncbi:hypothetical protein L218DRAFT_615538 [Marasmius fiardii PR-910]|nr:hypothetical protein L218DRAFT_615538 [Marasmius fiardii PR-910]